MAKQYGKWALLPDASAGEGGQAYVYKVTCPDEPGRVFALKRLRNDLRIQRFRAEVEALKKLEHPSIVPLIDYDLEGAKPWYVMPYHKNGSLDKQPPIPTAKALAYFEQILEAVAVAHDRGITHRDIKPGNILLSDDDRAVIADFGLCYFDEAGCHTLSDEVVGPRHFTAPELEVGGTAEVKPAADVYALGKLLYWLLTQKVLPRESFNEAAFKLPRDGDDRRLGIFSKFFQRSITVDPSARFASALEAVHVFKRLRGDWAECVNVPGLGPYRCTFCGTGRYSNLAVDAQVPHTTHPQELGNHLGISASGRGRILAMMCDHCFNVQLFWFEDWGPAKAGPWVR